jgi:hypothetical protein
MEKTILAGLFVFFACKQERKGATEGITEIKIISDESNRTDLLQFIEDIQLTPLETGDHCLIGNVRRIKADEDCFYITCYDDGPVKMFSGDGKFISEIGRKGGGPGEHIQISDILIHGDTVSIFAWSGNRKWIRYLRDNRFLYETDMPFPFDGICRIGNDKYLVYVGNGTVSEESGFFRNTAWISGKTGIRDPFWKNTAIKKKAAF